MAPSLPPNPTHQKKTWLDIAEHVMNEQDSQKLSELTNELIVALDEKAKQRQPEPKPAAEVQARRKSA